MLAQIRVIPLDLLQYLLCFTPLVLSSYKHDHSETFHHQTDQLKSVNAKPSNLFDDLAYTASSDESKLRLAFLVDDKIDRNKDGSVQLDELVGWLRECQDRYAQEDVNRHWTGFGRSVGDETPLSWDEYAKKEFEPLDILVKQSGISEQVAHMRDSHANLMQKDSRRWKAADEDGDGRLSKMEFKCFLYPEHAKHMHELILNEKYESMDQDKDGRVSFEEYVADASGGEAYSSPTNKDEWLRKHRSKFTNQLDSNHDKYLDKSELATYIGESELNDHSITEAQHLMQSADLDRDHRLSKEEILLAYHEFVNSHATDFGEALRSQKGSKHDEL